MTDSKCETVLFLESLKRSSRTKIVQKKEAGSSFDGRRKIKPNRSMEREVDVDVVNETECRGGLGEIGD